MPVSRPSVFIKYELDIRPSEVLSVKNGEVSQRLMDRQQLRALTINQQPRLPDLNLEYMGYISQFGDTAWMPEGTLLAGNNEDQLLNGFALRLTGKKAYRYKARYVALLSNDVNTGWVKDGAFCGVRNRHLGIVQFLVQIYPKEEEIRNAVQVFRKIEKWHANGGLQRAGLSSNMLDTFIALTIQLNSVRSDTITAIKKLVDIWNNIRMKADSNNAIAAQSIVSLSEGLNAVEAHILALQINASMMGVTANQVYGEIQRLVDEDNENLKKLDAALLKNENEIKQKREQITAINKRLKEENDKNILEQAWDAINPVTGGPMGVMLSLMKQLDEVNDAINQIEISNANISALQQSKKTAQKERMETLQFFSLLKETVTSIAEVQNLITDMRSEIDEFANHQKASASSGSDAARSRFLALAGSDIEELSDYNEALKG